MMGTGPHARLLQPPRAVLARGLLHEHLELGFGIQLQGVGVGITLRAAGVVSLG